MARYQATFKPDSKGLREMLRLPVVDEPLRQLAERGAGLVRSSAPVVSGYFRDSIIVQEHDRSGWERPRWEFASTDPKAHLLEYDHADRGGGNVKGLRLFGRAAAQLGGKAAK